MKLHKPTVRWCMCQLEKVADDLDVFSKRQNWDSTSIASRQECATRAHVLRGLAGTIKDKAKEKYK